MVRVMCGNFILVRTRSKLSSNFYLSIPKMADLPVSFSTYEVQHNCDHHYMGGKWEGVYDYFEKYPEVLERYEYIWLPDDDLILSAGVIETLFNVMRDYDLWLAQPALSPLSDVSWPITLACPGFKMRNTTFVELMAPCFKASFLRRVLPLFRERRYGFGLDQYWAFWTDDPSRRCGIIDGATVIHPSRRRKSGLYRSPRDPFDEREQFFATYRHPAQPHIITRAILDNGELIEGSKELSRSYFWRALRQLLLCEGVMQPSRLIRLILELKRNSSVEKAGSLSPLPFPEL